TNIGEEHVGRCQEPAEHAPSRGRLEVERDRALPPVGGVKTRIASTREPAYARTGQAPVGVAGLGMLDLDDIRTPLAQHAAGDRDEHMRGDLDDTHPGEWSNRSVLAVGSGPGSR